MSGDTYKPVLTDSITAGADIEEHLFIGFDGNLAGADKKAMGVSEVGANSGEQLPVVVVGIALLTAGGTIAVGDPIASDANAKGVKATNFSVAVPSGGTAVTSDAAQPNLTEAGGVLPQEINGYALDAASSGDKFRIKLI